MFWERFYDLCAQKGMKPNPVCSILGFSNATATRWKAGSIPNGDALLKISQYFDCSVDYLLGREDAETASHAGDGGASSFELTPEEQAFLEKLRRVERVNPEILNQLEPLIDNML